MSASLDIARLDATQAQTLLPDLVHLLCATVGAGASIGFWPPLDEAEAARYWDGMIAEVEAGSRVLLVARQGQAVVGSIQLALARWPNARHRAEVQKLMVTPAARRQGIGRVLLGAIEDEARLVGRTLLVLDTRLGDAAETLYLKDGYTRLGEIPNYVSEVDGSQSATVVFHKQLGV